MQFGIQFYYHMISNMANKYMVLYSIRMVLYSFILYIYIYILLCIYKLVLKA